MLCRLDDLSFCFVCKISHIDWYQTILPRDAMHSMDYAVEICLSVRLPVSHMAVVFGLETTRLSWRKQNASRTGYKVSQCYDVSEVLQGQVTKLVNVVQTIAGMCRNGWTYHQTFSPLCSHTIIVFHTKPYGSAPIGIPWWGRQVQRGHEKNKDFRPISSFISEIIQYLAIVTIIIIIIIIIKQENNEWRIVKD